MVVPEDYKKVLKNFSTKIDRKVVLFAVLKMDEYVDKWSILISVKWSDREDRQNIFSKFIEALQEDLDKEELDEIAEVVFYTPDEHLVSLFFEKFSEGQHIREDAKVNGNVVHEGLIVALNKNAYRLSTQSSLL